MTIPPLSSSEDESARSPPSDRRADALSVGLDAEPSAAWAKLTPDQRRDVEAHINGLTSDAETYNTPRRGWTCFHCGETFRTEDGARLHFGEKVTGRPACVHEAIAKAIDANIQASFSGHSGWSLIGHRKASDAILEALAAQPAPSDPSTAWRSMESAPRDGMPILAWNPAVGAYSTAFTTRWTGEPDEGGYEGFPCGFWPGGLRSYPFGKWDCHPTHWMPLPGAPS